MGFAEEIAAMCAQLEGNLSAVEVRTGERVLTSIVEGDPMTAAPGQPVRTGKLRDSWTKEEIAPGVTQISTDDGGAQAVEEHWDGVQFPNHGPHSVALTVAGFERIVEQAAREVAQ